MRRAGKHYQSTPKGKLNHAKRQESYLKNKQLSTQKVTHMGSPAPDPDDLLALTGLAETLKPSETESISCLFCEKMCSSLIRIDFLKSHKKTPECVLET